MHKLDLFSFSKDHNTLEVAGLWEEVEGLDFLEDVAGVDEKLEIAHLGGWITGDVNTA